MKYFIIAVLLLMPLRLVILAQNFEHVNIYETPLREPITAVYSQFFDYNGDGLVDVVAKKEETSIPRMYYNVSTDNEFFFTTEGIEINFEEVLGDYVPEVGIEVVFVDLENDSIWEIVTCSPNGDTPIKLYENIGDLKNPKYKLVPYETSGHPFKALAITPKFITFYDVDNDNDPDLFTNAGFYRNDNGIYVEALNDYSVLYQNQGTPSELDWLTIGDLNSDSIPDFVFIFEGESNLKSTLSPDYIIIEDNSSDNLFNSLPVIGNNKPSLVDLDKDNDLDMFIGLGTFYEFVKEQKPSWWNDDWGVYNLDSRYVYSEEFNPFSGSLTIRTDRTYVTAYVDLDSDGDKDLAVGGFGYLTIYENVSNEAKPNYIPIINSSIDQLVETAYIMDIEFLDFDNDGDQDLFYGTFDGTTGSLEVLENQGDTRNANFKATSPSQDISPSLNATVGDFSMDIFDYNKDGSTDMGIWTGTEMKIFSYDNVQSKYAEQVDNPFSDIPFLVNGSDFEFNDLDNDLDYDILFINENNKVIHLENTNSNLEPEFLTKEELSEPVGNINRDPLIQGKELKGITVTDYDINGRSDLILTVFDNTQGLNVSEFIVYKYNPGINAVIHKPDIVYSNSVNIEIDIIENLQDIVIDATILNVELKPVLKESSFWVTEKQEVKSKYAAHSFALSVNNDGDKLIVDITGFSAYYEYEYNYDDYYYYDYDYFSKSLPEFFARFSIKTENGLVYIGEIAFIPNSSPLSLGITKEVLEDHLVVFSSSEFSFSDKDAADNLDHVLITAVPTKGILFVDADADEIADPSELINSAPKKVYDLDNLRYLPPENAVGEKYDSIRFRVSDKKDYSVAELGAFESSDSAYTISFNIKEYNDKPLGSNEEISMWEDGEYMFSEDDFTYHDVEDDHNENDNFSGIKIVSPTTNGTLKCAGEQATVNSNCPNVQTLKFTPNQNETGRYYSVFTFNVIDSHGAVSSETYTFDINVKPVNDAPSFTMQTVLELVQDTFTVFKSAWVDSISMGAPNEILDNGTFELTAANPNYYIQPPYIDNNGNLDFIAKAGINATDTVSVVFVDYGYQYANPAQEVKRTDPQTFNITINTTVLNYNVVGLNHLSSSVQVYPNPMADVLNVNCSNFTSVKLNVYTIQGQKLLTKKLSPNKTNQINLSQLNRGMYLLKLETNAGQYVKQIIKQ